MILGLESLLPIAKRINSQADQRTMPTSPSTYLRHFECEVLPEPHESIVHGALLKFGLLRNEAFYMAALQLAHRLVRESKAGRALLLLDRAMSVTLSDPLKPWPVPYAVVAWILNAATARELGGNPRIHYEHLATRVRGSKLRQWRAWACWAIACKLRPEYPGGPVSESPLPTPEQIACGLKETAGAVEFRLWQIVYDEAAASYPLYE